MDRTALLAMEEIFGSDSAEYQAFLKQVIEEESGMTEIERLDAEAAHIASLYGVGSFFHRQTVTRIDEAIEREAIANDKWSLAEMRAMDGESL